MQLLYGVSSYKRSTTFLRVYCVRAVRPVRCISPFYTVRQLEDGQFLKNLLLAQSIPAWQILQVLNFHLGRRLPIDKFII